MVSNFTLCLLGTSLSFKCALEDRLVAKTIKDRLQSRVGIAANNLKMYCRGREIQNDDLIATHVREEDEMVTCTIFLPRWAEPVFGGMSAKRKPTSSPKSLSSLSSLSSFSSSSSSLQPKGQIVVILRDSPVKAIRLHLENISRLTLADFKKKLLEVCSLDANVTLYMNGKAIENNNRGYLPDLGIVDGSVLELSPTASLEDLSVRETCLKRKNAASFVPKDCEGLDEIKKSLFQSQAGSNRTICQLSSGKSLVARCSKKARAEDNQTNTTNTSSVSASPSASP